jgi:hypothetical protein
MNPPGSGLSGFSPTEAACVIRSIQNPAFVDVPPPEGYPPDQWKAEDANALCYYLENIYVTGAPLPLNKEEFVDEVLRQVSGRSSDGETGGGKQSAVVQRVLKMLLPPSTDHVDQNAVDYREKICDRHNKNQMLLRHDKHQQKHQMLRFAGIHHYHAGIHHYHHYHDEENEYHNWLRHERSTNRFDTRGQKMDVVEALYVCHFAPCLIINEHGDHNLGSVRQALEFLVELRKAIFGKILETREKIAEYFTGLRSDGDKEKGKETETETPKECM